MVEPHGHIRGAVLASSSSPPPPTFDRGRICSHPGCTTILSIYNPGDYCAAHESDARPAARPKRTFGLTHAVTRTCALPGCGRSFVTKHTRKIYCSSLCCGRAARKAQAERLASKEGEAEMVKYLEEVRDVLLAAAEGEFVVRPAHIPHTNWHKAIERLRQTYEIESRRGGRERPGGARIVNRLIVAKPTEVEAFGEVPDAEPSPTKQVAEDLVTIARNAEKYRREVSLPAQTQSSTTTLLLEARATLDPEIAAMDRIVTALAPLDAKARRRVLDWAERRHLDEISE